MCVPPLQVLSTVTFGELPAILCSLGNHFFDCHLPDREIFPRSSLLRSKHRYQEKVAKYALHPFVFGLKA